MYINAIQYTYVEKFYLCYVKYESHMTNIFLYYWMGIIKCKQLIYHVCNFENL